MLARYTSNDSITLTLIQGEVFAGNVGPLEITFNTDGPLMESFQNLNVTPDPYVSPPPVFPEISRRQIRLWLFGKGVTSEMVVAQIEGLPEPQRTVALIEWDGSTFQRNNPLVDRVGQLLGFSSEEMDEGWMEAATL